MNKPFMTYPHAHSTIREYEYMSQLWFENTILRNPKLSRKYINETEWTSLPEAQVASYPFTEFKHWKRYGLNPPTGLEKDLRYYSILEFVDLMSPLEKPIVKYKIEYEYKEVEGEWTPETWTREYFIDLRSIAETI